MSVSVIIPVYNAEEYVRQAVESAVHQSETAEVILIDDGSQDRSLEICRMLVDEHDKVKLFVHPDQQNLGASASRNLGISMASQPYIAFLDADDYYLPKRFSFAIDYLRTHVDCMAIAESITVDGADPSQDLRSHMLVDHEIKPDALFEFLVLSPNRFYSLNGIVFKKSVFDDVGLFDTSLRRAQDSDLIFRIAETGKLHAPVTGNIVARYRRHNLNPNRAEENVAYYRTLFFKKWLSKAEHSNWGRKIIWRLIRNYVINLGIVQNRHSAFFRFFNVISIFSKHPKLAFKLCTA